MISKYDLVFLVGSIEDKYFWSVRELILSNNTDLLITIVPDTLQLKHNKSSIKPHSTESFLLIDNSNFSFITICVIQDICSVLLLPTLICIDYSDIKQALIGRVGSALFIESRIKDSIKLFKKILSEHLNDIILSNSFILINSYDYTVDASDASFEHMENISEQLFSVIKEDSEAIWSSTDIQKLNTEFRVMLIFTKN
ncbi:MAG: hypothetical protein HQK76_19825 [Desulfobacterales bacterium]|nr:hypothetical protein [Desulfobacterales bacterium]